MCHARGCVSDPPAGASTLAIALLCPVVVGAVVAVAVAAVVVA